MRPQAILEMALGEPGALDRDLQSTKESAALAGLANKSACRSRVLVANACQQGLSLKCYDPSRFLFSAVIRCGSELCERKTRIEYSIINRIKQN